VGPDPGRRPKPDERTRSHTRPTRTPAAANPWPDKLNEWIAEGQPDPWEVRLVDMPKEYKARVQAQNRLRLGWRHQMRRLGLAPEEFSTRFVQTEDGVWWFRWWVR
jgi:hypothetical protein